MIKNQIIKIRISNSEIHIKGTFTFREIVIAQSLNYKENKKRMLNIFRCKHFKSILYYTHWH